jgi:hypothetical protein
MSVARAASSTVLAIYLEANGPDCRKAASDLLTHVGVGRSVLMHLPPVMPPSVMPPPGIHSEPFGPCVPPGEAFDRYCRLTGESLVYRIGYHPPMITTGLV